MIIVKKVIILIGIGAQKEQTKRVNLILRINN